MKLSNFTEVQLRKAMLDAGYDTYASLARKLNKTPQAVRKVIKKEKHQVPMRALENAIYHELAEYLPKN